MATAYFVDSSALVKRYVQEVGTPWVRGLTRRSPSTAIYIARITAVEVVIVSRNNSSASRPPIMIASWPSR